MDNRQYINKSTTKYFSFFNLLNKKNTLPFYKYRKKKFSQHGEEGILSHLIKKLDLKKLNLVEFGSWNGIHLSNTFFFIEKKKIIRLFTLNQTKIDLKICVLLQKFTKI